MADTGFSRMLPRAELGPPTPASESQLPGLAASSQSRPSAIRHDRPLYGDLPRKLTTPGFLAPSRKPYCSLSITSSPVSSRLAIRSYFCARSPRSVVATNGCENSRLSEAWR